MTQKCASIKNNIISRISHSTDRKKNFVKLTGSLHISTSSELSRICNQVQKSLKDSQFCLWINVLYNDFLEKKGSRKKEDFTYMNIYMRLS